MGEDFIIIKQKPQQSSAQIPIKDDSPEDQYRLFLQNSLSQIDDRFESEADEKSQSFIFLAQEYDASHPQVNLEEQK
jgi:hypothetical protein